MDETVEQDVGDRGVRNHFMPSVGRELAGDDGGTVAVTVIKDLHELPTLAFTALTEPQSSTTSTWTSAIFLSSGVRLPSAVALLSARNNLGA